MPESEAITSISYVYELWVTGALAINWSPDEEYWKVINAGLFEAA